MWVKQVLSLAIWNLGSGEENNEVQADEILPLAQGRMTIPTPTLRLQRTVKVGQEKGGFSGDSSRSPLWGKQKTVYEKEAKVS